MDIASVPTASTGPSGEGRDGTGQQKYSVTSRYFVSHVCVIDVFIAVVDLRNATPALKRIFLRSLRRF